MGYKVGSLYWEIDADTKKFDAGAKSTETKAKGLGKSFTTLGKTIATGFAVAAVAGIAKVSKELVLVASDAEETANKFGVVFGDIEDAAEAAAENLADNFGLSSTAAQALLADTGDLLTGFGFTQESALDLSDQVNQLAVDLASFTNFSGGAEGASQALTKALLGERESVKALGISILETDVNAKVLANTQEGLAFETERQAKAYATLQLAQEQSQNAIGDFARSSESFANQQRIAKAAVDDLKVAIGENLLPAATATVGVFGDLTAKLADFVEERNKLRAAEKEGINGTVDQLQILIEKERENIETIERSRIARSRKNKVIAESEANIAEYTERIRNLQLEESTLADIQEETARLERERAEAQRTAADELAAYLALVEEEYAKTQEGQIEALEKEIELWQQYAETAVETGPQVEAILDNLIDKYNELTDAGTGSIGGLIEEYENLGEGTEFNIARQQAALEAYQAYLSEQTEYERVLLQARAGAYSSFFGSIASLISAFGVQSKEQAIAIKAFSSAEAAINSYLAFTQVLTTQFGGPVAKIAAATAVLTAGLAQQVKILATPIPSFETGGIVPGNSFTGDNVQANVNSGEMILNRQQQAQLFDIANGGATASQTIKIQLDRKTIATAVVNAVNNGQGGTISQRVVK